MHLYISEKTILGKDAAEYFDDELWNSAGRWLSSLFSFLN